MSGVYPGLVEKFPKFYGNRRFIALFTSEKHYDEIIRYNFYFKRTENNFECRQEVGDHIEHQLNPARYLVHNMQGLIQAMQCNGITRSESRLIQRPPTSHLKRTEKRGRTQFSTYISHSLPFVRLHIAGASIY